MFYGAEVAVCSETNTKRINTGRQNVKYLIFKVVG
jgi:hypothetical protein